MSATATKSTGSGSNKSKTGGGTTEGSKTSAKMETRLGENEKRRLYRCFSERNTFAPCR
jgi:hypothetical protein